MKRTFAVWSGLVLLMPALAAAAQFKPKFGGSGLNGVRNKVLQVPVIAGSLKPGSVDVLQVKGHFGEMLRLTPLPKLPASEIAKTPGVVAQVNGLAVDPRFGDPLRTEVKTPAGATDDASGESLAAESRVKFDGAGKGGSLLEGLKGFLGLGSSPPKVSLGHPVRTIELRGSDYWINGRPAREAGFGTYKIVLRHPEDPRFVVKVFDVKLTAGRSLEEKDLEVANIGMLEKVGATPRIHQQGKVRLGGRDVGFVVVERVNGLTLQVITPTKLKQAKALFERLEAAGIEIADSRSSQKLRSNLMVGETPSGGWGIYLTDPDIAPSRRSRQDLRAFYEGLYSLLTSRD